MRLIVVTVFLLTPALVVNAQESGFADPILGRWDLSVNGRDGPYPSWMEIRLRTESQLMAEFVGRFGSKRHATDVRFADDRLEVRIPVQYERGGNELVFTGLLEDGRLSGHTRIDDGAGIPWTGVPAPSLHRAKAREWDGSIDLLRDGLSGWSPRSAQHDGCWKVQSGVLSATPPCVDLISDAQFEDFRLQLEFRYPSGSNSGVYLRGRYEVQIQDDRGKALDPLRIGGIYGFIAPRTDAARPAGEWQNLDIVLVGRRITITLNEIEIITNREIPGITGGALDSREENAGPLMLQGDHGPIEFRNIVITPGR